MVTANSGAIPNATDARDDPASLIPTVMKRFERPGAIAPAITNGATPSRVMPPWIAAATQRTANVPICMRSAPTAAGTTGGTSAKRTATGIAPNRAAETNARRTASIYGPRGDEAAQRRGCRRLGEHDPGEHHRAAEPAGPAEALREEEHAEERGERRLEGEDERGPRRGRARLHPRRDEISERPGEDARHDEGVPRGRVGRRLHLPGRHGDHREPRRMRRSSAGTSVPVRRSAGRSAPSRRSAATARRRSRGRGGSRPTSRRAPR